MKDNFPPWARWIAQDEDGQIWCFEHSPRNHFKHINRWLPFYVHIYYVTRAEYVGQGKPNPHWRNSLDCLG